VKPIAILFAMVLGVAFVIWLVARLARKAEEDPVMEPVQPIPADPVAAARRLKLEREYKELTDLAIRNQYLTAEDSDRLATVYNDLKRENCKHLRRPS